jgi:general secretion pathway protein H
VTLLELLVVMVLIALAASAVVLTAAPRQPSLSQEAARLAAQAALAQDEAALSGRSVALRLDAQGYRFERRAGPALWRPLEEPPFGPQEWGEEVRVDFSSRQPVVRIVFDAAGFTEAQTVVLRRGREGARVLFGAEGARVEAIP